MWKVDSIIIEGVEFGYEAKVYDEPSQFGIEGGRISKLFIFDSKDNILAAYDRRWIKDPKDDILRKVIEVICELYK